MVTALRNKNQRITTLVARLGLLAVLLQPLMACSTVSYYRQAITGQLSLMGKREPIGQLLDSGRISPALHAKLSLIQEVRQFAGSELVLPAEGQYTTYVELGRPYPVWNVFAAAEFSTRPEQWCFPIAGCVSYRGYFDEGAAHEFADSLRKRGLDVYVGGVTAYSSLGWFSDPVLSSFVSREDWQLAALVFHELSHQLIYVPGDTDFNESFATAVEMEGLTRWLSYKYASPDQAVLQEQVEVSRQRQMQFMSLVQQTARDLDEIYRCNHDQMALRELKDQRMRRLKADYTRLREQWGGYGGYDQWFGMDLNNAQLATVTLYNRHLAFFQRLLEEQQGDLPKFYKEVKKISRMSKLSREALLTDGT